MRSAFFFAIFAIFLAACGSEPPPAPPAPRADSGVVDTGADPVDTGIVADSGEHPDAEVPDTGTADTGATDSGVHPDAAPVDTGVDLGVDAGPVDTGVVPDTGVDAGFDAGVLTDGDNDGISDQDEGTADTDGDGTPDAMDSDSDNDGVPDSVEAGDTDLGTPPVDSDGDGAPDFRDLDADNDGIPDAAEGNVDTDNDGLPNYRDADADGDGIGDQAEGATDFDNDLSPNYLDPDSDGDGVPDSLEGQTPFDRDFDGTPNFLDLDSDADTISDAEEGAVDTDGDGNIDAYDIDSDDDGLLDLNEAGDADPLTPAVDADGDNVLDFRDLDSDNDTITDAQEGLLDTENDGTPDRRDLDSDNDGWPDSVEAGDADPLTAPVNTDGDLLPDYRDVDSDGDGLADSVEVGCPMGSNRTAADSDNDGFLDLAEIGFGSNPCDGQSGITGFYFVLPPLGPGANAPLSFADTEIDRADIALNIDTTGSMGGEIATLRQRLSDTIIPGVDAVIPDAAFSVSSFEDYPQGDFGAAGDLPFRLGTRMTTDSVVAQAAVNALTTRNGADFPESGLESLNQIATGAGTAWTGGSVAAFNPATGNVPGVADGVIGGVGLRDNALPIVIHITDAVSHVREDYQTFSPAITAASTTNIQTALSAVGARVVTVSGGLRPFNDLMCSGSISTFFGAVTANDVDWFELQGVAAGAQVTVSVYGQGFASEFDPMVGIFNNTARIAFNDDAAGLGADSRLTNFALTGTGPFYIAVASYNDTNFTGTGGQTTGHYAIDVSVNGAPVLPSPTGCRAEDANSRAGATVLVPIAQAQPPASFAQCLTQCETVLGPLSPLFRDFTYPYEFSEWSGAVVPACAWDFYGPGRPATCAANECCTGVSGEGVPPNAQGVCPLSFDINSTGVGLDQAAVSGIQALVNFSTFTITTVVREDPLVLQQQGIDTRCFIHGVVPTTAVPPNTCAPQPTPVDLFPPTPELDSWDNVVPGTVLSFQVNALNLDRAAPPQQPCAPALPTPQQFTAYIDVVADGVTVVDTRPVIIIVPPTTPGGSN